MNIFKKIINYFKKPKVGLEPDNVTIMYVDCVTPETNQKLFEALSSDYVSHWKVPKKLPLRDSRGRFTKKEENV